jgi:toxin CcdB
VVQSLQFKSYHRRVVVPLVRASAIGAVPFAAFNPSFVVRGIKVVLHPLEIVSIATEQLSAKVGSLASADQQIINAFDELFSRAWK